MVGDGMSPPSSPSVGARDSVVRVLDADADLAEFLHEGEREVARHSLIARTVELAQGEWTPHEAVPPASGHLGVLVLDGVLCREVAVATSCCAELVGPGDLLRPWDGDGGPGGLVSCDISWQVLEEARLAVLDRSFVTAAARWPALTPASWRAPSTGRRRWRWRPRFAALPGSRRAF